MRLRPRGNPWPIVRASAQARTQLIRPHRHSPEREVALRPRFIARFGEAGLELRLI
jgi:hypothetical protein